MANNLAARFNFWREYNDPDRYTRDGPLGEDQIRDFYRLHDYVTTEDDGPDPQETPVQPVRPVDVFDRNPQDDAQRNFLARNIPEIPDFEPRWKGMGILGKGNSSTVGHWRLRYDAGQQNNLPRYLDMAVKEAKDARHELRDEGYLIQSLSKASDHVVKLLELHRGIDAAAEGLEDEWHGKVKRLIMEYCSQGDLLELLERRIAMQKRFSEYSLWQVFECLVDGISVLEYGAELRVDPLTGCAKDIRKIGDGDSDDDDDGDWTPIVHFDLKPGNILLEKTRTHANTPICKIGDFGTAVQLDPNVDTPENRELLRRKGTKGYYAPEQFTSRWNHSNWDSSGVAGIYGPATNVWGIGVIMWMLAMCLPNNGRLDHKQPFLPEVHLRGEPPKGRTYGRDLEATGYSKRLKDLIFECLYEKPRNRPDVKDLKASITKVLDVFFKDADPEPWADFAAPDPYPAPAGGPVATPAAVAAGVGGAVHAPPVAPAGPAIPPPPGPAPAPPIARTVVQRCSYLYPPPRGGQCGKRKRQPTSLNPRCYIHANLALYP